MARRLATRVLRFPVNPTSSVGDALLRKVPAVARAPLQYELFPPPVETSPYTLDNLVLNLTAGLIRVTRLGDAALPRHCLTLWAVVSLTNTLLPEIEAEIAQRKERQRQEYQARIA